MGKGIYMRKSLSERIKEAVTYLENMNVEEIEQGKIVVNDDFFVLVQTYDTKLPEQVRYEAHKKYVDIQYIVEGKELMEVAPVSILEVDEPYSDEKDIAFYKPIEQAATVVLTSGGYVVFYPEDAHRPSLCAGKITTNKKLVGKVRV